MALVASAEKLCLAAPKYLCPRDAQWPFRLITTFVSVYATQKNPAGPTWGTSSIITLVVTTATTFVFGLLSMIYTLLKFRAYKVPAKPRDSEKEEKEELR
jgi:hypothetical protein